MPTLALIYGLASIQRPNRTTEHSTEAPDVEVDLTVADVAESFGRTPQTVRGWIREGKLAAYKLNGREYRVTRAALAEYQARARGSSTIAASSSGAVDLSSWKEERQKGRSPGSE